MPEIKAVELGDLKLYLKNYRTVRQKSESGAVSAMIATSPEYFWGLAESLLQDGYLPTENIIVLRAGAQLIVREGNRRIAALKLIHKMLRVKDLDIPDDIAAKIAECKPEWMAANKTVPCTIYPAKDEQIVDRIVTLTHGKGQKAGRDKWNAVARARHARDEEQSSQPGLDLLEKYIEHGKNITPDQKTRWSGVYPLSVLDEAVKRIAPRVGAVNSVALAKAYPAIKYRGPTELLLHRIGLETIGFKHVRADDFAVDLGLPRAKEKAASNGSDEAEGERNSEDEAPATESSSADESGATKTGSASQTSGDESPKSSPKPDATASTDPKSVTRTLKDFQPRGAKREKVATLINEARALTLTRTPLAFCFILRSLFEVSALAYCNDHEAAGGPKILKSNGEEKKLVALLDEITKHLTNNLKDKPRVKELHGAMTELNKSAGLLSVTSMNQLVHNPNFHVAPSDVALLFGNIFPLLRAMNE